MASNVSNPRTIEVVFADLEAFERGLLSTDCFRGITSESLLLRWRNRALLFVHPDRIPQDLSEHAQFGNLSARLHELTQLTLHHFLEAKRKLLGGRPLSDTVTTTQHQQQQQQQQTHQTSGPGDGGGLVPSFSAQADTTVVNGPVAVRTAATASDNTSRPFHTDGPHSAPPASDLFQRLFVQKRVVQGTVLMMDTSEQFLCYLFAESRNGVYFGGSSMDVDVAALETVLANDIIWLPSRRCAIHVQKGDEYQVEDRLTVSVITPRHVVQDADGSPACDATKMLPFDGDDAVVMHFTVPLPNMDAFYVRFMSKLLLMRGPWSKKRMQTGTPAFVCEVIGAVMDDINGALQGEEQKPSCPTDASFLPMVGQHGGSGNAAWAVFCSVVGCLMSHRRQSTRLLGGYALYLLQGDLNTPLESNGGGNSGAHIRQLAIQVMGRWVTEQLLGDERLARGEGTVGRLHPYALQADAVTSALELLQKSLEGRMEQISMNGQPQDVLPARETYEALQRLQGGRRCVPSFGAPLSTISGKELQEKEIDLCALKQVPSLVSRPDDVTEFARWNEQNTSLNRQRDDTVTMYEIERLVFEMTDAWRPGATVVAMDGRTSQALSDIWQEYNSAVDGTLKNFPRDAWLSSQQLHGRRMLVAMVIAVSADDALRESFSDTSGAKGFTMLPIGLMEQFLNEWMVDLCPRAHRVREAIKEKLNRVCTLKLVWSEAVAFGAALAADPCSADAMARYEQNRCRLNDLHAAAWKDVEAHQHDVEQLELEHREKSSQCPCRDTTTSSTQNPFGFGCRSASVIGCSCAARADKLRLLRKATTEVLHFPFPSPAFAPLYWLPANVRTAADHVTRLVKLMVPDVDRSCCEASACRNGNAWVRQLFEKDKQNHDNQFFHFEEKVAAKLIMVTIRTQSDILKTAYEAAPYKCSPSALQPRSNLICADSLKKVPVPENLVTEVFPFHDHPSNCCGNTPCTRGNEPYSRSLTKDPFRFRLDRHTYAVVAGVRAYGATQHRLALVAILSGHIDGAHLEGVSSQDQKRDSLSSARGQQLAPSDVAFIMRQTLLLASGHCKGYHNADHASAMAQWVLPTLSFIRNVSAVNALLLVVLSQMYCCGLSNPENAAAVVCAAIKRAAEIADEVIVNTLNAGEAADAWVLVERISTIGVCCAAFVDANVCDHVTDSGATAKRFLYLRLTMERASIFITKHAACVAQLKSIVDMASHAAIAWLPDHLMGNGGAALLDIIRKLDATIGPLVGTDDFSAIREPGLLHVYRCSVTQARVTTVYAINAYSGSIYVNGAPLAGLPESVRQTRLFRSMFGGLNFEVCQRQDPPRLCCLADFARTIYGERCAKSRKIVFTFTMDGAIRMTEILDNNGREVKQKRTPDDGGINLRSRLHSKWFVEREDQEEDDSVDVTLYRPEPPDGTPWLVFEGRGAISFAGITRAWGVQAELQQVIYEVPQVLRSDLVHEVVEKSKTGGVAVSETQLEISACFKPIEPDATFVSTLYKSGEEKRASNHIVVIVLERLHLSFVLLSDGRLLWQDDPDYIVADSQKVPWMPRARNYIRLVRRENHQPTTRRLLHAPPPCSANCCMKPEELIIIAAGTIDSATGEVQVVNHRSLNHVKVWRHTHFGYYEASDIASRMFLAALLAANDCGVVVAGCTLVEHIVVLLRRCFGNRPWTTQERSYISRVASHSHPSVYLLCVALEHVAVQLSFMPHRPSGGGGGGGAHELLFHDREISTMLSRYEHLLRYDLLSPACALTQEELDIVQKCSSASPLRMLSVDATRKFQATPLQHHPMSPSVVEWTLQVSTPHLFKHIEACDQRLQKNWRKVGTFVTTTSPQQPSPSSSEVGGVPIHEATQQFPSDALPIDKGSILSKCHAAAGLADQLFDAITTSWQQSCDDTASGASRQLAIISNDDEFLRNVRASLEDCVVVYNKLKGFIDGLGSTKNLKVIRNHQPHPITTLTQLLKIADVSHGALKLHDVCRLLAQPQLEVQLRKHYDSTSVDLMVRLSHVYVKSCVQLDCLRRVESLLIQQESMRSLSIVRELTSPREEIEQLRPWLVFEAEQRLNIRQVQFDTWKMLDAHSSPLALVSQLNMGEGKTRVIIPMLVLSELGRGRTACIHTLSGVVGEYREHYEACLSTPGLAIRLLHFPFDRDVDITERTCKTMVHALNRVFKRRMYLVVREHFVSCVVKRDEICLQLHHSGGAATPPPPLPTVVALFGDAKRTVHIFDEVDELLRHDFGLVYAVGTQVKLPSVDIRGKILSALLIHVAAAVVEERRHPRDALPGGEHNSTALFSWAVSESTHCNGQFPAAHLVPLAMSAEEEEATSGCKKEEHQNTLRRALRKFLETVLRKFHSDPPRCAAWMSSISVETLIRFCFDNNESTECSTLINETTRTDCGDHLEQLMLLRGAFLHRVLPFALSRRVQENYGVPPAWRDTLLAVPYDAADIPSKRSEFAQPDVSLLLTLLAYFHHGLNRDQFYHALLTLVALPRSSRESEFASWLPHLKDVGISPTGDIDVANKALVGAMYARLRNTMSTIAFWVRVHVFDEECKHFPEMLTGSAWDVADVPCAIGFSGTSDARFLLPESVEFRNHCNPAISSATGVMMRLFINGANTIGSVHTMADPGEVGRPLSILREAIALECNAVIDVGAAFAGARIQDVAKAITRQLPAEQGGVCYFDADYHGGQWVVLEKRAHILTSLRHSMLRADQCFVLFDQARCRGADLRLSPKTVALVTLGGDTTKDSLMQAVGRLRQFGRGQRIKLIAAPEVMSDLGTDPTAVDVLAWSVRNTLQRLSRGLPNYVKAATHHSKKRTAVGGPIVIPHEARTPFMYRSGTLLQPLSQLLEHATNNVVHERVKRLAGNFRYRASTSTAADTAEREVMREVTTEQEHEREETHVPPLGESVNDALLQWCMEDKSAIGVSLWLHTINGLISFAPGIVPPASLSATANFCAMIRSKLRYQLRPNAPPPMSLHTILLRRVETVLIHVRTRGAIWISPREAACVVDAFANASPSAPRALYNASVIHTHPTHWGGITIIFVGDGTVESVAEHVTSLKKYLIADASATSDDANYALLSDLQKWVVSVVVFTMLFNGASSFKSPVQKTVVRKSLNKQMGKSAKDLHNDATFFLRSRGLFAQHFADSDLHVLLSQVAAHGS